MIPDPRMVRIYERPFETCAICGRQLPDEMSLMVDTERGLLVVCYICDERRDEGFEEDDDAAD